LDEDDFYMKVVAVDEIYNFLILSFFSFEVSKMIKNNNIKFQQHINCVRVFVFLEKLYLSCTVSNEDTFYMKVVAFNKI
jgi:hypothetical protein